MTESQLTIEALLSADVEDLGRQLRNDMPQSPNHPKFFHALVTRHGDGFRDNDISAANDYISMGTHIGTHVDAPAHISANGSLHGGLAAAEAQLGGVFNDHGIHLFKPALMRAVLLDLPAVLGVDALEPEYEVTVEDCSGAISLADASLRPGDALVFRTGWSRHWENPSAFIGLDSGVPGPGREVAEWFIEKNISLVGSDTTAFEVIAAGRGHGSLPVHKMLLVDQRIPIVETMFLDDLAAKSVGVFVLVMAPLNVFGATGSPVRPLAILP